MKRVIAVIIGAWFFFTGLQDLLAGEAQGFGTMPVGTNHISFKNNPIEFSLKILFKLALGTYLIKVGMVKENKEK